VWERLALAVALLVAVVSLVLTGPARYGRVKHGRVRRRPVLELEPEGEACHSVPSSLGWDRTDGGLERTAYTDGMIRQPKLIGTLPDQRERSEMPEPRKHLAGTWIVTVNRPPPLPPVTSMQVYTEGGSALEEAMGWPAARTTAYGSWKPVQAERLYRATTVFFRFDPQTGAFLSSEKVNRTIQLEQDGDSFTVESKVTRYDQDGNLISKSSATGSGKRMDVETDQT
jgi:hypothetical protein